METVDERIALSFADKLKINSSMRKKVIIARPNYVCFGIPGIASYWFIRFLKAYYN